MIKTFFHKDSQSKTKKKLNNGIAAIVALAVCLSITTVALALSAVTVQENAFKTGGVGINLNDGQPVIQEQEFNFEPGMTVTKDFFVENESTWDVYYKLYFNDVSGGLANVLEITIKDGSTTLYNGTASQLSRQNVVAVDDLLRVGERKDLTINFHFPEEAGNATQGLNLAFTFCAEATQTKNNPNKLFD